MKRLRPWIARFWRDNDGVAALEFAIILPVLMLLTYGGYEGWRMVLAGQRVDNVAYSISDLSARLLNGTTEGDVTNMLEGGAFIARPFDLEADGRVILSAVDPGVGRQILWQRCFGGANLQSSLGQEGGQADVSAIRRMPSSTDSLVFVTETKMKYVPPLVGLIYGPITLTRTAVVPGRATNPVVIDAGGPVSTC